MTVRVRVVAYNVRGFRDDRAALERLVRRLDPDVLLLNETGARWRLRRFARGFGLDLAADPWSPFRRRVKDAVLVRPPWSIAEHRQRRFSDAKPLYPRGALIARIERDGASLWAISIHLGLRPGERLRHVEELVADVAGLDGAVVVGGDTNERPGGRAMTRLAEALSDAWRRAGEGEGETIPADAPRVRIDYLFTSPDVEVDRAWVPSDPEVAVASDHRPIVADLVLG